MLSTPRPTVIYGDAGAGDPGSAIARPFDGLTTASDGVVNVAIGGHVRPIRARNFRVHAGFATSQSPVRPEDQVFNNVDLYSWTLGVSGAVAKFQFAAGINQRFGTSSDVLVRNLLVSSPLRTNIDVSTVGFIYSIGYQFLIASLHFPEEWQL